MSTSIYDAAGRVTATQEAVYEDGTGSSVVGPALHEDNLDKNDNRVITEPLISKLITSRTGYNAVGKAAWTADQYAAPTADADPSVRTRYRYDDRGNLVETLFPDGTKTQSVIDAIPLKRIATTDDVALSICFLLSDWSRHITGEIVNINGGAVLCG